MAAVRIRRGGLGLLLVLAALLAGGCRANTPLPLAPSLVALNSQLPAATVAEMAHEVGLPSLKRLSLKVKAHFGVAGRPFTLVAADAQPPMPTAALESAGRVLAGLRSENFPTWVQVKGQSARLIAQAKLQPEPERVIVAVRPDSLRRLRREGKLSDTVTAFTTRQSNGRGRYAVSFVTDSGVPATTLGQHIPQPVTLSYTEMCQNVLMLAPDAVASLPPGVAKKTWQRATQEAVCNNLGVAMALARGGITFDTYEVLVGAAPAKPVPSARDILIHLVAVKLSVYQRLRAG